METWWLLPISAVCNRDQTYSLLLLGAELGSRVATGISQESEPCVGAVGGGREYLVRFLLSTLFPFCNLAFTFLQG